MDERKKILLISMLALAASALVVVGLTIYILYETSVANQLTRLEDVVVSRARLLETMARYDAVQSPDAPHGPLQITLDQIKDTERFYVGFGHTGGFALARLEGGQIVYIVRRMHGPEDVLESVPLASPLAEPMRRALSGRSGSMIGLDYRGELVAAAYEPLPGLGLAMVAKIDLAEIREPYITAGLYALAATVVVVLLGALVLWRLSGPLVRRLEESEERFRFIFEQAPLGVTILGPDLRVIRANAELARQVGRKVEDLPGTPMAELTHPEDREASLARSRDLLEGRVESHQIDKRYLRPDGSVVWGRLTARLHRDRHGHPAYIISLIEDITERKKTLEELELSRRTAQTLIDTTEDTILLLDQTGIILACNQAWAGRAGKRVEEMVGTHVNEHIPTDKTIQREAMGRRAMATGQMVNFEDQFVGRYFDYHLHPVPGPDGGYSRVAVYARDITQRRRTEQALSLSEQTFRMLFEGSMDAVFFTAPDGTVSAANPVACEMFGCNEQEIRTAGRAGLMDAGDPRLGSLLQERDLSGQARGEATAIRKDGSKFPVEISSRIFADQAGAQRTWIAMRDISKRKQAEAEREALIAGLQEALAKVRTLSGLLPICSSCKKIRNDQGYWERLESYLGSHAGAEFTHGICPQCAKILYPDLVDDPPQG
jgi:PAS domain S-box-containing protein